MKNAIILLIIIAGVAAYFLNKFGATDWETYSNTKYNYSIQYPKDWDLREYPAFNPIDKPGYPDNSDSITTSVNTSANFDNEPLDDYIRKAGAGIQDYTDLASIKEVEATDGVIGYETTWMMQPFLGRGIGLTESLPITFFEIPSDKSLLIRVYLNREEDLEIYEQMLTTLKFSSPD